MLVGKKVRLRALEPSDYALLAQWMNDPDVMVYWGRPGNTATVAEISRREEANAMLGTARKYVIQNRDDAAVSIGQIDYYDLDWQYRSAWISIMVADSRFWGGGYGTDAMRTLLRYLFEQLGLHRVTLTVHEHNERAQKSYRKNGFQVEGVLREWQFFNGAWENGVLMAVLDRDFRELTAESP